MQVHPQPSSICTMGVVVMDPNTVRMMNLDDNNEARCHNWSYRFEAVARRNTHDREWTVDESTFSTWYIRRGVRYENVPAVARDSIRSAAQEAARNFATDNPDKLNTVELVP